MKCARSGRELGLAAELLDRHPFPGPGLAIRCLCSETGGASRRRLPDRLDPAGAIGGRAGRFANLPAGAGDRRFPGFRGGSRAADQSNGGINRVVVAVWTAAPMARSARASGGAHGRKPGPASQRRRHRARIWRRNPASTGRVWQFPVVLIPVGTAGAPGFRGAASHRFGGRHDGARGPDAGRAAQCDGRRTERDPGHSGRVLRPHQQAAGDDRVGIDGQEEFRVQPKATSSVSRKSKPRSSVWW